MSWTEEKNNRRIDLIDKDIAVTITEQEQIELYFLQAEFHEYLKSVKQLPIEEAREVYVGIQNARHRTS